MSTTCDTIHQIPGPVGAPGADGTNGTDGINAFSLTTADFVMPALGGDVTIVVDDTSWMSQSSIIDGQIIHIQGAGYFFVKTVVDGTHVTITDTQYTGNTGVGTNVTAGKKVSPGGLRGPQGTPGSVGTMNSISPTSVKGDLIVDDGANTPLASDVRLAAGTNKYVLHADSGLALGLGYKKVDLTGAATALNGALAIANGGTGQVTREAALDALMAFAGVSNKDLVYYNGTHWVRLASANTGAMYLRDDATWQSLASLAYTILQTSLQPLATFEVNHTLGAVPKYLRGVFVCVKVGGVEGFAQNDEVDISSSMSHGVAPDFMVWASATKVGIAMNTNVVAPSIVNKSTNMEVLSVDTDWNLKIYYGA